MRELVHGGDINAAAARFGLPRERWIDLSTGISPWSWPVPDVPASVWRRLPEEDDGLVAVAADYYGCDLLRLLPVPGSQHAIRRLPGLWPRGEVALPLWGYEEHRQAWASAGHRCWWYRNLDELRALASRPALRYAVVINPNNPLGTAFAPGSLLPLAEQLGARGGRLLVDEAFIDVRPGLSVASQCHPALVTLRSVGKFFGLAGMRLGFVIADEPELAALGAQTNPWSVSHPARWVGAAALADRTWQHRQRHRIACHSEAWLQLIQALLPDVAVRSGGLFISFDRPCGEARRLQEAFARQALWIRVYEGGEQHAVVRMGLPRPAQWREVCRRLERALSSVVLTAVECVE